MIEILFNQLVVTLSIHFFAYAPFIQYFRWSKKCVFLIAAIAEVFWLVVFGFLQQTGIGASVSQLLSIPLFGAVYFLVVKIDWGKIMFMYIFSTAYGMALRGAAGFIEVILFHGGESVLYSWQSSFITIALFIITMPLMLWYFKHTSQMVIESEMPLFWKIAWTLPLFNTLTVLLFTYYPADTSMINSKFLLARILLLGCMFIIYFFILYSIRQLQQQIEAEEHVRFLKQLTDSQAVQYAQLNAHIEETRRARHDLRQHLKAIQGYIEKGDAEELAAYVKVYGESIPKEAPHNYCQNYAVDSVLGFYAEKAAQAGIQVKICFCSMPETIIPEPEFCVILGNLLENALEACSQAAKKLSDVPHIDIRAQKSGSHTFILTVDNTSLCPPNAEEGKFLSSKHEGFGIGTESVRNITEKYHGDARFVWKEGMFYASVMLNF